MWSKQYLAEVYSPLIPSVNGWNIVKGNAITGDIIKGLASPPLHAARPPRPSLAALVSQSGSLDFSTIRQSEKISEHPL
jgi:hypothetical protein